MVFKHNKLSFDHDDTITCQVAFQHMRQLDFGSQGGNLEFQSVTAVTSNVNNVESVRSENNKRPAGSEEHLQFAAKRTRQMDGNFPLFSIISEESFTSSENSYIRRKLVAVGPDHQACIPSWRPKSFQNRCRDDGPSPGQIPTKIDCHCLDEGSIRCVRQHVMEAREQLRSSLGREQFVGLGLCEMGEDVALGWAEEEEDLFDEVVASNPASEGNNFWHHLRRAFPCRSSKELVSYYFNVFMLRKRAEQNRLDPLNVDSDNDEWQPETGEDGDGIELKCSVGDVLDGSCMSYEDCNIVHDFRNDGISGIGDGDFFVGDCDLEPWDVSCIGGLDKELDLLPTCVIEEVFRSES